MERNEGKPNTKKLYLTRTMTIAVVKKGNILFADLDDLCYKSKNIYNSALYLVKQTYIDKHVLLRYEQLDKLYRQEYTENYKSLYAKSTQKILQQLCLNVKMHQANAYKTNRHLFPKYKHKTAGRFVFTLDNQQIKYENGYIILPIGLGLPKFKINKNLSIEKSDIASILDTNPINQLRVVPKRNSYIIELVYTVEKEIEVNNGLHGIAAIDLGINNFATLVCMTSANQEKNQPMIINGQGLKSYVKHHNKKVSKLKKAIGQSDVGKLNNKISSLYDKRERVTNDFYKKAARLVVNYCLERNIQQIVVGYNKGWKKNCKLNSNVKQTFNGISYYTFIQRLTTKAAEFGISVITQEESYTSGTSFLDGELPIRENYNKSRRKHRGLFIPDNTMYQGINADVNAAYQIMVKRYNKLVYTNTQLSNESFIPIKINIDTFATANSN